MIPTLLPILAVFAASVVPPTKQDVKLPVEVDFAQLKNMTDDLALNYDFYVDPEGSTSLGGVRLIELGETPEQVRDAVLKNLKEGGWKVKAVGDTKLMVYSHKDGPVRKVEFKVDTFGAKPKGDPTPTAVRVKAK